MPSPYLNLNTCTRLCGRHEYSITSGHMPALPLRLITQAIREAKYNIAAQLPGQVHGVLLEKSTIRCNGAVDFTVIAGDEVATRVGAMRDAIPIDEAGAAIILDWHLARREWRAEHPLKLPAHADYNLTWRSTMELAAVYRPRSGLNIIPVLDSLEVQDMAIDLEGNYDC